MAKKKNTIPTGFDDILGNIYSNAEEGMGVTDIDAIAGPDVPLVDDIDETQEPPVQTEDGNKTDDDDSVFNESENESPIQQTILDNTDSSTDNQQGLSTVNDEPTDADLIEAQQVSLLFDAVGQSLGWNMDEIEENDRPVTVDGLTQYLKDVVDQNSVPRYADERIQQLDEYVKNGGKFEDFYARQQEAMSIENLNLDDEVNQKAVIRELLKYDNYTDEQINKKIARYEDSDMLYEESEDALDRLKLIRKLELEEQTKQQELYRQQQEAQSKAFFETVTNDINSLTHIRGIAVPKEDRKALFDYIFKVDKNGLSQYQKDFNQNLTKNLIESAYFTMKADALISSAKKDGESSATEKLRKMLRHSTKNHTSYNIEDKQKSVIDLASGLF